MIFADHIAIDGDTAWWIITAFGEQYRYSDLEDLDRPCDLCGGEPTHMDTGAECHGCSGTGRHTFTLDVEQRIIESDAPYIETIKVHVVEVLPIVEFGIVDIGAEHPIPCVTTDEHDNSLRVWAVTDDGYLADVITLPDTLPQAAARGMWAVELKIHKGEDK